jgi:hypothetical protein
MIKHNYPVYAQTGVLSNLFYPGLQERCGGNPPPAIETGIEMSVGG